MTNSPKATRGETTPPEEKQDPKPKKPEPIPEAAKIIFKALSVELTKLRHAFPKINILPRPVEFKEVSSTGPIAQMTFKTEQPEWILQVGIDGQVVTLKVDCKNNMKERDPNVKLLRGSLTKTYSGAFGDVMQKFIADIRKIA